MSQGSRRDRPAPTPEQEAALAVKGSSVALTAGAGTGKTFVLAERFVRALEGPEGLSLGRVVALTFTKKAARELRERIRRECRARLERAEDPTRWRRILRGLEAARIGTFHAFCGEILREHAIEGGVDPGFAVLDESIAVAIRQEAVASTLRDALTQRDPDLIDLAVEYGLGMVRQSIDGLLANRSAGEIRDWIGQEPGDLVALWLSLWESETRPALIAEFRESLVPCLELIERNEFSDPKVNARVEAFREAEARLELSNDPATALKEIGEVAIVLGLAAKLWPTPELYQSIMQQFTKIRASVKTLGERLVVHEKTALEAASQGLKFARLTLKARESYAQAKRDRGGIDNDDLLLIARELLTRPGSSASQALSGSIDLILVDEFQDTDPVQAEVLESLAGSDLVRGKLFLVGDVKQSIYRFRGARPDLFASYRRQFPEDGRRELTANFRSVPAILAFVNALFGEVFPAEENPPLRPGSRGLESTEDEPAVEFLWGTPDLEANPDFAEKASAKLDANARRKDEAKRIARHLKTRLDRGWRILDPKQGQPRPADPGDVAFLFRSLSDASDYEQALAAEGFDYHVVGGSGYFAQQEVLDLINVLTAVEDPLDSVSLAGALRSPFFSLSDDALFWISTEKFGQPHEGLERCSGEWLDRLPEPDRPRADRARRLIEGWRSLKDRLPIATLVDRILADSGYEAALIGEFLGERKRANARKLVGIARQFDAQGGFTLADFVARLRADLRGATRETQAATTDEEGRIIRLMTIHQAKGLEFPIVILPDVDRKRPGERTRVAFDRELGPLVNPVIEAESSEDGEADEADAGDSLGWTIHRHRERKAEEAEALRLFYVAVTRARDSLVISSATPANKRPTSPALRLLEARFVRENGRFQARLPDGWPEPRVRVLEALEDRKTSRSMTTITSRPRPSLLDVARRIEEGLNSEGSLEVAKPLRPRTFDLDPAFGLPSTSSRLDRLIRTILADPRAFESGAIEAVATWAARVQDPISPPGLIDRAIAQVEAWGRSPEGRELTRSPSIRRGLGWAIAWPPTGPSTLFRGRAEFLFRLKAGGEGLVCWGDPGASEPRERLRLLLSAIAARRLGYGEVRRGWWVRPGSKVGPLMIEDFEADAIDRAVAQVLRS